ncbi:MAG: hypothetical protein ACW96M_04025 [Candidatus Thorarchaeota archaeon]
MINWTFTKSVLFTAYDVYRSNDFWLDSVINSGATLKDAIVDLGFPSTNTLVADTGIFEMEARKAGIARNLGIDIEIELSNGQIFEAYEMSGADYFVSPDEIVLPLDSQEEIRQKVNAIKDNLSALLETIPSSKVIAVIQGHQKRIIDELLSFYRENGVKYFAMGGVIPLYHHDRKLLEKVLKYVRKATRKEWLHVFGLPHTRLLSYYLHDLKFDSVDTSMLLYLSARRRYLVGSKPVQVRNASFEDCDCIGCKSLASLKNSTRSANFLVNLYIHNIVTASKESLKPASNIEEDEKSIDISKQHTKQLETRDNQVLPPSLDLVWRTAGETMKSKNDELQSESQQSSSHDKVDS